MIRGGSGDRQFIWKGRLETSSVLGRRIDALFARSSLEISSTSHRNLARSASLAVLVLALSSSTRLILFRSSPSVRSSSFKRVLSSPFALARVSTSPSLASSRAFLTRSPFITARAASSSFPFVADSDDRFCPPMLFSLAGPIAPSSNTAACNRLKIPRAR